LKFQTPELGAGSGASFRRRVEIGIELSRTSRKWQISTAGAQGRFLNMSTESAESRHLQAGNT
jgi:hypothetical protein